MRVGFVGLGTMGGPMARRLLEAGHELTVYNRTSSRQEPLVAAGARAAGSPAQAAEGAEIVVMIVSDTPDVEAVLFGDGGVAEGAAPGTLVVDMSTISPEATHRFGERLAPGDVALIDAPVSGGSEGAQNGTLTIMVGGEASHVERARPLLEVMGSRITHVGPLGAGQTTKAVNQVVVGGIYLAVAEGLVLGMKAGLDMDRVVEAISAGACRSWVLENRAKNMLQDTYPLGFKLGLHRKDLQIALGLAAQLGADLPGAGLLDELEAALISAGLADEDVSVVAREIRRRAGLS